MENASQALTMAAAVLIALLMISLIVVFYNNIRSFRQAEENETYVQQVNAFNKQYETYQKNLYGSEMLSLVNKAVDYNLTESADKGYVEFNVYVTFSTDIGGFKSKQRYSTNQIKSIMDKLQSDIETYGNKKYANYKVSQLALMRTNELQQLFTDRKLSTSTIKEAKENIALYNNVKTDEVTIKSKIFKFEKSTHDNNTGRLLTIEYKEN